MKNTILSKKILFFGLLWSAASFAQTPSLKNNIQNNATGGKPEIAKVEATKPVVVLGFLEWKAQRVHEAQQKLEQMGKTQGATSQEWQEGKPGLAEDTIGTNEHKLNFNVDVALQLNVQDYFSMYLKGLSPEEFKEATKDVRENIEDGLKETK